MSSIRDKIGDAMFRLIRPTDQALRKALGEASLLVDDLSEGDDDFDESPAFTGIGDARKYFLGKSTNLPHELYSSEIEQGVPPPDESSDYLDAYMNSVWAYRCVNVIAQSAACVPFKAQKRDKKEEKPEWKWDEECALAGLIQEPNDQDNTFEFIEGTLINLEAVGNAFWSIVRATQKESSMPVNLYNVRADRIKIVPKGKTREVKRYEYFRSDGKSGPTWKPRNMVHLSLFHPTNPFFGLSPMSPALIPLVLEFWVQAYNKAFFRNSGRLDAVLETENILGKIAYRRAKRMIKKFVGPKRAHQLAILEDGLKYRPVQSAPKDAEWKDQRRQNMTELLATWGVVPIMLGLTDRTPWANAKEQKRVFWENTMIPVMTRLMFWFNKRISSEYNVKDSSIEYRAMFDYSGIAALKEDRQVQAEVLATLVKWRVLTINEARKEINKDEVPWGNQPILPTKEEQNTPDYPTKAELATDPKAAVVKLMKHAGIGEEITEAIVNGKMPSWMRRTRAVVDMSPSHSPPGGNGGDAEDLLSDFRRAVGQWTPKYARRSEKALKRLLDREMERLTTPTNIRRLKRWAAGEIVWHDLGFDHDLWVTYLRTNGGYPLLAKIIKQFGDDTLIGIGRAVASIRKQSTEFGKAKREIGGVGVDFNLLDPNVTEYMQTKPMRFASDLTGTTFNRLSGDLQTSLAAGLDQGESIQQLTARTQGVFANTKRALPARSLNIARTEVGSASNFAINESYNQSAAVKSRQWVSVQKPTTRDAHRKAHRQVAKLGEPFTVWGEKMQFPGDPAGSAKNVCSCLCSTKAVLGEPEPTYEAADGFVPSDNIKGGNTALRAFSTKSTFSESGSNLDAVNELTSSLTDLQNRFGLFDEYKLAEISEVTKKGWVAGEVMNHSYKWHSSGVTKTKLKIKTVGLEHNKIKQAEFVAANGYKQTVSQGSIAASARHGVGHWVTTGTYSRYDMFNMRMRAMRELGDEKIKKAISDYATESGQELLAESFSMYTAPGYRKGALPNFIERAVEQSIESHRGHL